MAFPTAGGYGNLPNGNFSPVIYSKKVQKALRKASVIEDVTNTDYSGDIANFGDSVKIIKEPDITINSYARGTSLATQDLTVTLLASKKTATATGFAGLRSAALSKIRRQTTTNCLLLISWTSPTSVAPISALRLRLHRFRWLPVAAQMASPALWRL